MSAKAQLKTRLSSYWKLEVGNAALVPGAMAYFCYVFWNPIGWVSLVCFVPMILLLVIGGLYWRGKYHQLGGRQDSLNAALKLAHVCEIPLVIALMLQTILMIVIWSPTAPSSHPSDRVMATIALSLAVLEHINYYHRQLQHFDNGADFRRLLSGKGFRRAQMHVDLKRWRARRRVAAL